MKNRPNKLLQPSMLADAPSTASSSTPTFQNTKKSSEVSSRGYL